MMQLDETSAGRVVELPVGQVVELRLRENPTTGFHWQLAGSPAAACRISDDGFRPSPQGAARPGQGGLHRWRIEGVQVGACQLDLAYLRPWVAGEPPRATFALRISVTARRPSNP